MGQAAPSVRSIVLNWNGGRHVLGAVEALLTTDWSEGRHHVVVVDNASSDGSDRELEAAFPQVEVRRSPTNVGFPGNNLAMADLDGVDYVALVNNDAFVTPGWLAPLVAALEADLGLGAAAPKLVFAPRFVEVTLSCATFQRSPDSRDLGVRVSGVEVNGADRLDLTFFGAGCWGEERGPVTEPRFRWTAGEAHLGLPLWDGPGVAVDAPVTARLRLACEHPVTVTIAAAGETPVRVEVGTVPRWHEVTVGGPAFDVVQNAGSMLLEGGYCADRGFCQRDDGRYDTGEEVFAWCGGAVLLRADYLRKVGLFEPRFFMYYEDTDLAWRGRAQGWRYRYVPESVVRHLHATSSGEGSPLFQHYVERNRLLLLTRNAPRALVTEAVARYLLTLGSLVRAALVSALRRRRPPALRLPWRRAKALGSYLRLLPRLLADRRRLRRAAVVDDAALGTWIQPRSAHPF
jgi:hypothetical protein